jgi:DNA-binding Lrp family transcriptional regulator
VNTAIVHIDCATDSIPEVAEALAALDGVSEVYSVAGNVDLIAIVRVAKFDSKTPGVLNTESHIAFRAYSKHDLEDAFAIGLPDAD